MSRILRACTTPIRWLRDRYRRADVPDGWTPEALAAIRPTWDEPLTGELPAIGDEVDTGHVLEVEFDELGPWVRELADPVEPWLFDLLRDLHPVSLDWQPSWAVTL